MAETKDNEKKVLKGFKKVTKKLLDESVFENWKESVSAPLSKFSTAVEGFKNEGKIDEKLNQLKAIQGALGGLAGARFGDLEVEYNEISKNQEAGIANDKGASIDIARGTNLLKEKFKALVDAQVVGDLQTNENEYYEDNNKDLKNGLIGESAEFDTLYSAVKKLHKLSKGLSSKATFANGKEILTEVYSGLESDLGKFKDIKFYKNADEYEKAKENASEGNNDDEKKK